MENNTQRNIVEKAKLNKGIDRSKGSLFNSWRARVYTKKGKLAGFPDSWKTFKGFLSDIPDGWSRGKILVRKNSKLPFSKENCYWGDKGDETCGKLIKLTYNGETKTIAEWCIEYNLNYNGVRQRYFKGKNYTIEEILFGKIITNSKNINSIEDISSEQLIKNKISKKGHTIDNVVPCCYECNVARTDNFTYEEMLEIGKAIKRVMEDRYESNIEKNRKEG